MQSVRLNAARCRLSNKHGKNECVETSEHNERNESIKNLNVFFVIVENFLRRHSSYIFSLFVGPHISTDSNATVKSVDDGGKHPPFRNEGIN